jgi:predicted TIM-barrel fold metal-dependent hydrolase
VIHLRTQESPYGRKDAEIFIDSVLSKAPNIPIQIAHMAGWSGYDEATDRALNVFAERISNNNLREDIYFDLSAVIKSVDENNKNAGNQTASWYPQKSYERPAMQRRKIGMDRILFGTDWPEWTPRDYKADIIKKLPLTASELQQIFANRAPWFK